MLVVRGAGMKPGFAAAARLPWIPLRDWMTANGWTVRSAAMKVGITTGSFSGWAQQGWLPWHSGDHVVIRLGGDPADVWLEDWPALVANDLDESQPLDCHRRAPAKRTHAQAS